MSATFWSRALKLGIGRLDGTASAQALERPLAEQTPAVTFNDDALTRVVEQSQGYPYFLQLWGAALWRGARDGDSTRIDERLVEAAAVEFDRERTAYYEDRREELERQALLGVAVRVADAFAKRTTLSGVELNAAITAALGQEETSGEVLRCRDDLAGVGYVWKPPDAGDVWQPGIPSLAAYVAACDA